MCLVLVILFLGMGMRLLRCLLSGMGAVALIALKSADGFLLYRTNAIREERQYVP